MELERFSPKQLRAMLWWRPTSQDSRFEAIVCDGKTICRSPLKPRNLSGRTGRGDTTFATYLTERLSSDIPAALEFAAAAVSLKMEAPGPFNGTRQDVLDYIQTFYR